MLRIISCLLFFLCTYFHGADAVALEIMLPQIYEDNMDISGWLVSEKLDGVRGYWDGKTLMSKNGIPFNPPAEFLENFLADDPGNGRFFASGQGDRFQFDLPAYGLDRLRKAGVGSAAWTRHCTYSNPDKFFSYRRSVHAREADYGRLVSTIRL